MTDLAAAGDARAAAAFLRRVAERTAINRCGSTLRVRAAGEDLTPVDAAAGAVTGLERQIRAGDPLTISAGGLGEAERYQVSLMLDKAADRARDENAAPGVAAALSRLARQWDEAAGVTERHPALKAFIAAGRPAGVQPRDLGA